MSIVVPPVDLAPSLPSRIVTVRVTDLPEGGLIGEPGWIEFVLPGDLRVPGDDIIVRAGSVRLNLDDSGEGQVRLPVHNSAAQGDGVGGDWYLLVQKSWTQQVDMIRVPVGTGNISLADINPVVEVTPAMGQWLLTNATVTATEGSQWGASVSVDGGIAHFDFTFPPGGTAWYRGLLDAGTDLNTLAGSASNGIYILGASATYPNQPFSAGGKLTVETTTTGATEQRAMQYGTGTVWRRYITNYYSNPKTWSPWQVDSWDKGRIPNGTNIDELTTSADNGLHRIVSTSHRSQLTGTFPTTPSGATLVTPAVLEVLNPGATGIGIQRMMAPGLGQFMWFRSQGTGGVWQAWQRVATTDALPDPSTGGGDVAAAHMLRREAFQRRRGGRIGTAGKAVVALRFDDSMNGMIDTVVPALSQHRMPGTLVTCSKPFTTPALIPLNDRGSWELAKQWAMQDGIEVWHHGGNHQDASGTTALTREIVTSAADLRAALPELAIEGWAQPGVGGTNYDGAAALSTPAMFYESEAGRLILQEHAVSTGHRPGRVRPLLADGHVGLFHRAIDEYTALQEVQDTLIPAAQDIGGGVVVMLHPDNLGKTGTNTTVAQFQAFIAWLAAERDAGRIEILTMSGIAVADSRSSDRLNLLGKTPFGSGWTTTGWTVAAGVATNTTSAALSKTITAELFDWAYGAVHELRVKADGTGTVRLTLTSGSWTATRDFPVTPGVNTLRLFGALPQGATSTVAQIAVVSGTGVEVSEPSLHAA